MRDLENAPLAAPARRIYARAIEAALPLGVGTALAFVGAILGSASLVRSGALLALSLTIAVFVANAFLLGTRGQTLGKVALQLRVVRPDGALPGWNRAFLIRELLVSLIGLIPVLGAIFGVVDGAMLLWTERRRSLHDELADTIVVDLRPGA